MTLSDRSFSGFSSEMDGVGAGEVHWGLVLYKTPKPRLTLVGCTRWYALGGIWRRICELSSPHPYPTKIPSCSSFVLLIQSCLHPFVLFLPISRLAHHLVTRV